MQIQRRISKRKKKALVGQEFDLVLEGMSEETDLLLEGRTPMHAPEIDGKVFVNDVPEGVEPGLVNSIAARSPKLTTMILSPGSFREVNGSQAKYQAEVPHLQAAGQSYRRRVSFLQPSLPPDRSGQMGQRRVRHFVAGARRG